MAIAQTQPKKPKPSRFTLAPLYLVAGLTAGYVVLRFLVPALRKMEAGQAAPPLSGWQEFSLQLSDWVVHHTSAGITVGACLAVAAFLLPVFLRPARYLIWIVALAIILFDVALVAGSFGRAYSSLVKEANQGR